MYLKTHQLKTLNNYCKEKCQQIVIAPKTFENKVDYKGLYIGYMFGVKLTNYLIDKNIKFTLKNLASHLKEQKSNTMNTNNHLELNRGITKALYALINYLPTL